MVLPQFPVDPDRVTTPVGGRLCHFKDNWLLLTEDRWILSVVSGYSPEFISRPFLHRHPKAQIGMAQQERELVTKEIHTLLEKGAILRVKPTDPGYYSNLFIVPKKDGGSRPVINLKALNSHLSTPHFKMEGTQNLKDILAEADYMVKLDLQDAYLSVPMHKDMCKYLRFCWEGDVFEFLCLPFGLGPAPMVFTKLLKPVVSYLRLQGIRILVYLDDMLLMAQSVNVLETHVQTTIRLLCCLGFILNIKKCQTTPSQTIEFLGFLVNSRSMTLSLPEPKVLKIRKECRHMRNQSHVTGRQLAHLIGLLTSCLQAILQAPLHYRALQRLRNQALVQGGISYDRKTPMSKDAQQDLLWWIQRLSSRMARPIRSPLPDMVLETDASTKGWGANYPKEGTSTGGHWSVKEATHHINWLELKGAFLALQCFARNLNKIHILLMMDSQVAITYVNKKGGTRSRALCDLALKLWDWCIKRSITVEARHLPGRLNTTADYESRHQTDSSDWSLDQTVFNRIMKQLGGCNIDLFANYRNAKLDLFYSWRPDPKSQAVDALVQPWGDHNPYLFPPFSLIGRCLQKLKEEDVQAALLVAPLWPQQAWYPVVLDMLMDTPRILPQDQSLVKDPGGNPHPLQVQGRLKLVVWPISGNLSKSKAFLEKVQSCTVHHGDTLPPWRTHPAGNAGLSGVVQGTQIPLRPL